MKKELGVIAVNELRHQTATIRNDYEQVRAARKRLEARPAAILRLGNRLSAEVAKADRGLVALGSAAPKGTSFGLPPAAEAAAAELVLAKGTLAASGARPAVKRFVPHEGHAATSR